MSVAISLFIFAEQYKNKLNTLKNKPRTGIIKLNSTYFTSAYEIEYSFEALLVLDHLLISSLVIYINR